MTRCPLCKARYRGQQLCRRCRADLSIPVAVEDAAALRARHAVRELVAGNIEAAKTHAAKAAQEHGTRFHSLLYGFVALQKTD